MASHITFDETTGLFVARISYAERVLARQSGFSWSAERRRWECRDLAPVRLAPFMKDRIAAQRLAEAPDLLEEQIDQSYAPTSDFDIPAPEGLEFLPYQRAGVQYATQREACLIGDDMGLGKGHPLWFSVLTPTGPRQIGDLAVGDEVLGSNGRPTRVIGVHDRGLLPTFTVRLSDGVEVPVDGDHLWKVRLLPRDGADWEIVETRTLQERISRGERFEIPLISAPARLASHPLPIDVTAMAVWYADPSLYSTTPELVPVEDLLAAPASQRVRFIGAYLHKRARINPENRVTVSVDKKGELLENFAELVRSIGGLALEMPHHDHSYVPFEVILPPVLARDMFGLHRPVYNDRRLSRALRPEGEVPAREIVAIEPYSREEVRCISVAAPDRLYVVEGHVVTHNTVEAIGVGNHHGTDVVRKVLILAPATLKVNWAREWKKWSTLGLTVGIAGTFPESYKTKDGKRRTRMVPHWPDTDVVIVNYDILDRFKDQLLATQWDLLICDEAHVLKNEDANRTRAVFGYWDRRNKRNVPGISWRFVLFLTGTPIMNRPADLWTIAKACDPDGIGRDWKEYAFRYCGGHYGYHGFEAKGATNLDELHDKLRSRFMVRRLKKEVLKELPPKSRHVIVLPADGLQKKVTAEMDAVEQALALYEAEMGIRPEGDLDIDMLETLVNKFRTADFEAYAEDLGEGGKDVASVPVRDLAVARRDLALMKVPMIVEHVKRLRETEDKVIVFAWHTAVIEALREAFPNCASIAGDISSAVRKDGTSARQDQIDRFQEDPECHEFIGQIQAAGVGATLTAARVVVFAELDWRPGMVTQAEDRAWRLGQTENVLIQHLVVENSLDDRVVQSLITKQAIADEGLDRRNMENVGSGNAGPADGAARDPQGDAGSARDADQAPQAGQARREALEAEGPDVRPGPGPQPQGGPPPRRDAVWVGMGRNTGLDLRGPH